MALAFDNGDPAVIEAPRDRGTVIQVATSADAGWTTWPLHPSYPPVMEQIIFQAASGRLAERNVRVGQPLDQALPVRGPRPPSRSSCRTARPSPPSSRPPAASASSTSRRPSSPAPTRSRSARRWRSRAIFAANPNPAESDPAKLDRAGLAEAVPGWNFAYLTNWKELTSNATSVSRRGELHRPLLYGVLILLIVESILAWRFGHHVPRRDCAPPRRDSESLGSSSPLRISLGNLLAEGLHS